MMGLRAIKTEREQTYGCQSPRASGVRLLKGTQVAQKVVDQPGREVLLRKARLSQNQLCVTSLHVVTHSKTSWRGASLPRSHRWCRPDAQRPNPVGFSFALAGLGQPLILPFRLLLFGRRQTDEPGGPPLFEPSLKVERNIGHIKPLGLFPRFIGINALGPLKVRR